MSSYGTTVAAPRLSPKAPSPEPSTIAISGTLPSLRRSHAAASSTRSKYVRRSVTFITSQQHRGDARRHEVRERAGEHRAQAEPREIVTPIRHERADAADLDADRREVREPAERERGHRERARIQRIPQ